MNGHEESDRPIVPAKPAITDFWELLQVVEAGGGKGLGQGERGGHRPPPSWSSETG